MNSVRDSNHIWSTLASSGHNEKMKFFLSTFLAFTCMTMIFSGAPMASEVLLDEFSFDRTSTRSSGSSVAKPNIAEFQREVNPAQLSVAPLALTITLPQGAQTTRQLQLQNIGDRPLGWALDPNLRILIFSTGLVINQPGAGPASTDLSVMEDKTLGMNLFGFGAIVNLGIRLADEIILEHAADIDSFHLFGYKVDSGPVSLFSGVNVQLWDAPPNANGAIIFGDTETNIIAESSWIEAWRVSETEIDQRRALAEIVANPLVHGELTLPAGTYWLDFAYSSSDSGPLFSPPLATFGEESATGNALQFLPEEEDGWVPILDWEATESPQGLPIEVYGTLNLGDTPTGCTTLDQIEWLVIEASKGRLNPGELNSLTLAIDSTGLELGVHSANLCIFSATAGTPVQSIDLDLTVTASSIFKDSFELADEETTIK